MTTIQRIIGAAAVLAAALQTSCQTIDCGVGTIERDGVCMPADETVSDAVCGPMTELAGDQCVPIFDPTVCDETTTTPVVDPDTGVVTCVGTGGGGCDATFACPQPADNTKQTICGQLFDFEDDTKFQAASASGTKCTATTADGPCALSIRAFDALAFGMDPQNAPELEHGEIYIDDCGRYRVPDITIPTNPFVGLGIDDANAANMGPLGVTNTVGIATAKRGGMATPDLDGWIVRRATTDKWTASGGPPISGGIYAPVYRRFMDLPEVPLAMRRLRQDGVTFIRSGNTIPAQDHYFMAGEQTRETIDAAATVTGMNGTALITGATVADLVAYSGQGGGLSSTCRWETRAGASLPFIVFIQNFYPINAVAQQCDRR